MWQNTIDCYYATQAAIGQPNLVATPPVGTMSAESKIDDTKPVCLTILMNGLFGVIFRLRTLSLNGRNIRVFFILIKLEGICVS